MDNPHYFGKIEQKNNKFFNFIEKLITNTSLTNILKERAAILSDIYVDKIFVNRENLFTLDATDNIKQLWTKLCEGQFSATITKDCNNCAISIINIPTLLPNHSIITKNGFKSLQHALKFRSKIYNKKFSCVRLSHDLSKTKRCKLFEIPTSLNLGKNEYRLTGVAAYLPNHYLAYCWRTTTRWEVYNDLSKSVQSCSSNQNIEPHAAIYIIKNKNQ